MSNMKLAKLWYPLHPVQTELCKEQAFGTLAYSSKKNIKKQLFSQRPLIFPHPAPGVTFHHPDMLPDLS